MTPKTAVLLDQLVRLSGTRRKLILSLGGGALAGLATLTGAARALAAPNATPASRRVMQWGAFVEGAAAQTQRFETLVGRKMDLQSVFVEWQGNNSQFPLELAPYLRDAGKVMVLFWESWGKTPGVNQPQFSLDMIALGKWDRYIAAFAAAAKRYAGPVILNPFHEMNGNWYPWCGTVNDNSATKLIAAWRHVHSFFRGVNNVKFGWVVNSNSVPNTSANAIAAFYPGDAYVDCVGVDGFNGDPQWPWASFKEIFAPALVQLQTYRKPMYIFSIGCAQGPKKASWILDALGTQVYQYPLAGWVWFNSADYKVELDPSALAAFQRVVPKPS